MPSTIAINLCASTEELATELCEKVAVRVPNQAESFLSKAKAQISQADFTALALQTLLPVITSAEMLGASAGPEVISPETALSLLLLLLGKEEVGKNALVLAQAIASGNGGDLALRAKLFNQTYNSCPSSGNARYQVFKTCVECCKTGCALTQALGAKQILALCKEWNSSEEETKALLLSSADALGEEEQQECLVAYLELGGGSSVDAARVKQCALNAIRLPQAFGFPASALARLQAQDAKLHQLVLITSGRQQQQGAGSRALEEYMNFVKANPDFETSLGQSPERTLEKIRLLALANLGGEELSYAQVGKALHIPEAEVERWVIKAIGARLVQAKIDQVGATVTVLQSAVPHQFETAEQWKQLSGKLAKLKTALKAVAQEKQQDAAAVVVVAE